MPQTIENSAAPDSSPFNEHQGNIPPAAVNTSQQLVAPTIAPQQAPPDPAPILQINNSLSQQQQPQQQPTQRTVLLQNDFNFKTSSTFTNTSNSSSNSSSSNSKLGNRQNKNEITIESSGKSTELKDAELSGENSSELMSVESEEDYSNEIINPETVQKFNRVSKRIDTLCRDHIVGNDPTVRYQKRRLCKKRNASGRKCVFKGLQDHCCPFMGTNIACLHGGARWTGMQSTKGKVHAVEVVFQDVKLDQDYLCGYLTIKGLTLDYPILTTYFEADIIGNAHRFLTQKWQANFDTDLKHWSKFKEFEALKDQFCNGEDYHQDHAESDFLFMRWKDESVAKEIIRLRIREDIKIMLEDEFNDKKLNRIQFDGKNNASNDLDQKIYSDSESNSGANFRSSNEIKSDPNNQCVYSKRFFQQLQELWQKNDQSVKIMGIFRYKNSQKQEASTFLDITYFVNALIKSKTNSAMIDSSVDILNYVDISCFEPLLTKNIEDKIKLRSCLHQSTISKYEWPKRSFSNRETENFTFNENIQKIVVKKFHTHPKTFAETSSSQMSIANEAEKISQRHYCAPMSGFLQNILVEMN